MKHVLENHALRVHLVVGGYKPFGALIITLRKLLKLLKQVYFLILKMTKRTVGAFLMDFILLIQIKIQFNALVMVGGRDPTTQGLMRTFLHYRNILQLQLQNTNKRS